MRNHKIEGEYKLVCLSHEENFLKLKIKTHKIVLMSWNGDGESIDNSDYVDDIDDNDNIADADDIVIVK